MSDASETRSSLLRRVRDPADSASWREFHDLYGPLVIGYLRSYGLTEPDARDVAQEVFVKLLRELPHFELDRGKGRFRTWLWQLTRTAAADWARRGRRLAQAEENYRQRLLGLDPSPGQEPEPAWLDAHHRRVLRFVLERVRSQTQPATWACFERHLLQGRPSPEVAAEQGLTPGAVRKNASTVLARVRQQCADYLEELGDA